MNEVTENIANPSLEPPAPPSRNKVRIGRPLVTGCLVFCCLVLVAGLALPAVQKVREAAARSQSMNNLKMIGSAIQCIAESTNDIPPAYGAFPDADGRTASFFRHLLPYIEQWDTESHEEPWSRECPIMTFRAPGDPRNPRMDGTISYCTNGTLLSGGVPSFKPSESGTVMVTTRGNPGVFRGRASGLIVVMERSGLDGAHKWTEANNVLGTPEKAPSFPQIGVSPRDYRDDAPQAFTSPGCLVLLGDGSVRPIERTLSPVVWQWACDPASNLTQPPNW